MNLKDGGKFINWFEVKEYFFFSHIILYLLMADVHSNIYLNYMYFIRVSGGL